MDNKSKLPLPGFQDLAPSDRFCDLILTGGVTSAIAYPSVVFGLGMAYRFRSIGGSSSGAGVAAMAAAAEYRRRLGSPEGFRVLLERIDKLAETQEGQPGGRTGLERLFQPEARFERLFNVLLAAFSETGAADSGWAGKAWRVGLRLCGEYKKPMLWGAALAVVPAAWAVWLGAGGGWLAAGIAAGALLAALALLLAVALDAVLLGTAEFGICDGLSRHPRAGGHPSLMEWLHELLQDLAGRTKGDAPLTFADLAGAPGSPRDVLGDLGPGGKVAIELKMFTAGLANGRPFLLPQEEKQEGKGSDEITLFFKPSEMRRLFPDSVVQHMVKHGKAAPPGTEIEPPCPGRWLRLLSRLGLAQLASPAVATAAVAEHSLYELPRSHLPVVVACRMSLAFPVLFRAVPLWMRDQRSKAPVYRRGLFADGGLCSNFPIHLFDSLVPAWPTFGVSLREAADPARRYNFSDHDPYSEQWKNLVHLPDAADPPTERMDNFGEGAVCLGQLLGFAGALIGTMKDWSDATLERMPGVRERVVQIQLPPGVGGLNLRMNSDRIRSLATLGAVAVRQLLERYSRTRTDNGLALGWEEHRWVRLNVLAQVLAETLAGLRWSAARARHALPLAAHLAQATERAPLAKRPETQLREAEAAALQGALDTLMEVERSLGTRKSWQPYQPHPRPKLRIRPPL